MQVHDARDVHQRLAILPAWEEVTALQNLAPVVCQLEVNTREGSAIQLEVPRTEITDRVGAPRRPDDNVSQAAKP